MATYDIYGFDFGQSKEYSKAFSAYYLDTMYNMQNEYFYRSLDFKAESCDCNPLNYSSSMKVSIGFDYSLGNMPPNLKNYEYMEKVTYKADFDITIKTRRTTSSNWEILARTSLNDVSSTVEKYFVSPNESGIYYERNTVEAVLTINHTKIYDNREVKVVIEYAMPKKYKTDTTEGTEYGSVELDFVLQDMPCRPTLSVTNNHGSASSLFAEDPITVGFQHKVSAYYEYYMTYTVGSTYSDQVYTSELFRISPGTLNDFNSIGNLLIPEEVYNYMTDSKTSTVTFTVATYLRAATDSTSDYSYFIGNVSVSRAIEVQDSAKVRPEITSITCESYCIDPSIILNNDEYIESLCKVRIKVKTKTYCSASIASYKVHGGPNGKGSLLAQGFIENEEQEIDFFNSGILTPTVEEAGTFSFTVTVTDSRGFVSEGKAASVIFLQYYQPITGSFVAYRSDKNGEIDDEAGQYIYTLSEATVPTEYYNADMVFKVNLYVKNGNDYTLVTSKRLNNFENVLYRETVIFNNISLNSDYKVELIITDYVRPFKRVIYIPSAGCILDVAPNGSFGIGKIAREDELAFDVGMKQINHGNINPNINNSYDLGTFDLRWKTVYAVSIYPTSDMTYKENISYVAPSNKVRSGEEIITQEDLHNFYKSDYLLATYNYIGQEQAEYGFITQDMYNNIVGESLIIRNENGDMFSINSYISSIAGALQYEINLRDQQIAALLERIEALENGD